MITILQQNCSQKCSQTQTLDASILTEENFHKQILQTFISLNMFFHVIENPNLQTLFQMLNPDSVHLIPD